MFDSAFCTNEQTQGVKRCVLITNGFGLFEEVFYSFGAVEYE